MKAVERAYQLAQSGRYANFSEIKKAMRREFNVDHELAGKQLAASLTHRCKEARQATREQAGLGYASSSG
jgi:hypothetical protein